uniref:Peptidase A2 domain-containing protein n=1 Tax=Panagrolaimus superbus TaxID=310955 RepID=A0A914YSH8_9BILA
MLGIPKYNGDYLKWNAFWQTFDILVHQKNYPNVSKLIALRSLLEGRALEEIDSFTISVENYDTVVKTLKDRFGNPQFLIREFDKKLTALRPAAPTAESLRFTVVAVTNLCREMKNFGLDVDSYGLKNQIINKMPPNEKCKLQLLLFEDPSTSTDRLLQKMKKMEIKAELFSSTTLVPTGSTPPPIAPIQQPIVISTPPWKRDNKFQSCKFCDGPHQPSKCFQYRTPEDKVKQLKIKKCCINCMADDHMANNCSKKDLKCLKCNNPHYSFLCLKSIAGIPSKTMLSLNRGQSAMLARKALVSHPSNGTETEATVLFDSGSQRSYVTKKLMKKLDLPIVNTENLTVTGFGGKVSCYISDLALMKLKNDDGWLELYANSTERIVDRVPVIERKQNDTFIKTYATPDILIGMDYYCEYISDSKKISRDMHRVDSKLGEMFCGAIPLEEGRSISSIVIDDAPDECEMFWKLEAMGITDRSLATQEDEAAVEQFKETMNFQNNRYYISWPFKAAHPSLPSNAGLSIARLRSTVKKLQQNSDLWSQAQGIIDDQVNRGTIERAPRKPQGSIVHYLPHHFVITPQKTTTKVRMVFNGSAKALKNAPSLNECMYRGPIDMPEIPGLLCRLRTSAILLTGDIEKAFHQIYLNEPDRDAICRGTVWYNLKPINPWSYS